MVDYKALILKLLQEMNNGIGEGVDEVVADGCNDYSEEEIKLMYELLNQKTED